MTAVVAEGERSGRDSGRTAPVARVALAALLALLATGCLVVVASSQVRQPAASVLDALALACDLVPVVVAFVSAGFIVSAPGLTAFAGYLAVALVLYAIGASRLDEQAAAALPGAPWFGPCFTIVSCFAFLTCAYLFPNGRFVPSSTRWLLCGWGGAAVLALAFPWNAYPFGMTVALGVLLVLLVASLVASQMYRFRRVSTLIERQQTKWVLVALIVQLAWLVVVILLPPGSMSDLSGLAAVAVAAGAALISTALSVAIALAMLRYRLFDLDVVIGRALVWVSLSLFVAVSYLVMVGMVGLAWPAGTPVVLPVAATAIVAVGAEPLRRLVQRAVNRRLYGLRDEPTRVFERLGDELASSTEVGDTLDRLVRTVAGALRLPHVEIETGTGERAVASAVGDAVEALVHYPLDADGERVGVLRVGPRRGERLSPRDDRMLAALCPPAASAIRSAELTARVRASSAALVAAQEEERRRLQRELHDGLGPTLASVQQRIGLAELVVATDPVRARELLRGAHTGLDDAVGEVRGVVAALRPAVLDEHGLGAAIARLWASDPRVTVAAAGLPPLDAAVSLAAYRIATEAVANALRHSACTRCEVVLEADGEALDIRVSDDGRGLGEGPRLGNGLRTMRERAQEVGGSFGIRSSAAGTAVNARLPLLPGTALA